MSEKRPSARPLYKDIYSKIIGHADLLGLYNIILAEVCWGDYIVHSKRKSQPAKEGEFITTLSKLKELAGGHKNTIKRNIAILVEMGVITLEYRGKQTMVITNTNTVTKTAKQAIDTLPKEAAKSSKKTKSHETKSSKLHFSKVQNCTFQDLPKVQNCTFRPFPSSILKEEFLKEELLKENQPEFELLGDLKLIEANEILEAYKKRFILNVNHIERFIEKYKESNKTKEDLLEGIEILYANTILRSTTTSPMRLFELNEHVLPIAKEIIGRAKSAFYNCGERNIAISSLLNDKRNLSFFGNQDKASRVLNDLWDKVM